MRDGKEIAKGANFSPMPEVIRKQPSLVLERFAFNLDGFRRKKEKILIGLGVAELRQLLLYGLRFQGCLYSRFQLNCPPVPRVFSEATPLFSKPLRFCLSVFREERLVFRASTLFGFSLSLDGTRGQPFT